MASPPWGARGFSLAEISVALGITAIVFLVALSMLSLDQKVYNRDDAVLETGREARHTLDTVEHDLVMAGYLVDRQTVADPGPDGTSGSSDDIIGQSKIVYAAPYEVVVNADADPTIEAIKHGVTGDHTPTGYSPVTFHTGAETIRYTLDSNHDGTINATDYHDEPEETVTDNTNLALLRREVYGFNGTDNVNTAGPVGIIRAPVAYPSGSMPTPLFLYWGTFYNRTGLTLWGDNGAGGGTAGNGVLEPGELTALTAVTGEDANHNGVLDSGEDRNANGVLDRDISDLIKKVEVHVTSETPYPDPNFKDTALSSGTTAFRYHVVTISTDVKPRNIELPGGACGQAPHPTSSATVVNACANPLADGKVTLAWGLSSDDGSGENDVQKYIIYRTDQNGLFGTTPMGEVVKAVGTWEDDWVTLRTWPPRQYWYRVRAMDCTPQLSNLDPTAGPYPARVGPSYPLDLAVNDVPGDLGSAMDLVFPASPDDPVNTTTYGEDVTRYYVYRSDQPDYSCVPPVNRNAIPATGASAYTYRDDSVNSNAPPVQGTLYYYWLRAVDNNGSLSPYSPRYCGRATRGPVYPTGRSGRVAYYSSSDHPPEINFAKNDANDAAGYDPYQVYYRIYRASTPHVDDSVGYTAPELQASIRWTGLVWTVGGTSQWRALHSIDGAAHWREKSHPTLGTPQAISMGSRLHGTAVGNNGRTWATTDGGISYSAGSSGTTRDLHAVAHVDADTVLAAGDNGTLLRSRDGGLTWDSIATSTTEDLRGVAAAGQFAIVTGMNGTALTSTDAGRTFSPITFTGDALTSVCAVTEPGGTITVWAGGVNEMWHSSDAGSTWNSTPILSVGRLTGVSCLPNGHAMAISHDFNSVLSWNGSWWTWESIATWHPTGISMISPRLVFVSDENGRVHYRDPDGNWNSSMAGTSSEAMWGVFARPEIAWQDTAQNGAASGSSFNYIVTSHYNQGTMLDGESGMIADRSATYETPDDIYDQVLVDSCNNIELTVFVP